METNANPLAHTAELHARCDKCNQTIYSTVTIEGGKVIENYAWYHGESGQEECY